jgi:small subunit ribosomal protein S1
VATPNDVVRVGETVEVVVLDVKTDKGKISLSRKAALPDPWDQLVQQHKVGDLVYGTVTALAPFGAFISLSGEGFEGVEGLVHISELSRYRVETPSEVVAVGEGVWVKVLGIDASKRRLSLSLRRALE